MPVEWAYEGNLTVQGFDKPTVIKFTGLIVVDYLLS